MTQFGDLVIAASTDRGLVREENEDSFSLPEVDVTYLHQRGYLVAIADGVGGGGSGSAASQTALSELFRVFYGPEPVTLEYAIQLAHMSVRRLALSGGANYSTRMSTTLVALLIQANLAWVAHLGDSRAYLVRPHGILQMTRDHTLAQEQLAAGMITAEQAAHHPKRNVITRAIGSQQAPIPEVQQVALQQGDVILLCTDGLTNHVDDLTIGRVLTQLPPNQAVQTLIDLAKQGGGSDNITAAVVSFGKVVRRVTEVMPDQSRARQRHAQRDRLAIVLGIVLGLVATYLVTAFLMMRFFNYLIFPFAS